MESNGVFEVEMEMNSGYSFKSLLLDGEGMDDEAGIVGGAPQLGLKGDLDGVDDTLYRDDLGMAGRESFKSLLLDGEIMEDDEIHFSPADQESGEVGNGNHVQITVLATEAAPQATLSEEGDSFSTESNHGFSLVDEQAAILGTEEVASISKGNSHGFDIVVQQAVRCVEMAREDESMAPPQRKRRRGNVPNPGVVVGERNASMPTSGPLKDLCGNAEHVPEIVREIVSQTQGLGLQELKEKAPNPEIGLTGNPKSPLKPLPPLPSEKQAEKLSTLRPGRKKKQLATSSDVQKLLDSVIARQEMFFADLLESTERKEAIRERLREEKEEKWRAEERYQLCAFNNAMVALTQELLGSSKTGAQLTDKRKWRETPDH